MHVMIVHRETNSIGVIVKCEIGVGDGAKDCMQTKTFEGFSCDVFSEEEISVEWV